MLNEAAQILLPLTGISKDTLYQICPSTEVGLQYNEIEAGRFELFVFVTRDARVQQYIKNVCEVIEQEDKGLMKRLFTIRCKEVHERDWSNIRKGKYYAVSKDTVNNILLPSLRGNRKTWKSIFYGDEELMSDLIRKKLEPLYKDAAVLKKHIKETLKDIKEVGINIKMKPINSSENVIRYDS